MNPQRVHKVQKMVANMKCATAALLLWGVTRQMDTNYTTWLVMWLSGLGIGMMLSTTNIQWQIIPLAQILGTIEYYAVVPGMIVLTQCGWPFVFIFVQFTRMQMLGFVVSSSYLDK
jgi:hypothetical protein